LEKIPVFVFRQPTFVWPKKLRAKFHEIANGGKSVLVLRSFQRFKDVKLQHKNEPLTTLGKRIIVLFVL